MKRGSTLLQLLAQAHEKEKGFLTGLAEAERSQTGTFERWSAKDIVAHIAFWKRRQADNIGAALGGRTPIRAVDYDHENETVFGDHRSMTWEEVLSMAEEAHHELVKQVNKLGEERLDSTEILPWQEGRPLWRLIVGTYNHSLIHISDYFRNSEDSRRAGELIGEMARSEMDLDDSPEWRGAVQYNLACFHSLLNEREKAIEVLRQALELNPGLKEWSKEDPDLEPIRAEPGYQSLTDEDH